jgi:hypothetical protein
MAIDLKLIDNYGRTTRIQKTSSASTAAEATHQGALGASDAGGDDRTSRLLEARPGRLLQAVSVPCRSSLSAPIRPPSEVFRLGDISKEDKRGHYQVAREKNRKHGVAVAPTPLSPSNRVVY